ncbi:MAG TPA: ABC transporter ATP-binding protein, partial [Candidatus Limnocylindria bacterium]|nr:ABC transporter ATP-binding protein [Candidatus Limnocylindria bacterium]
MTTLAVEAIGLVKEFERGRRTAWQRLRREPDHRERFRAVDGVDLRVESGEIFGVLGPNGAGKTTTMKMLATLLEPTEGSARVLGLDVVTQARQVRRRMGAVLSDGRSLYWKLTARENLEYFAALYHVPPGEQKRRISAALAAVKLDDRADDYVERFSTGMRQRLVLARALLPDPELLLLDEPTVGLDPQSARDLRDRVRELQGQGRTVLLTTHYMEEADQLCDRIAIVDHGRVVALDTPGGLKRTVGANEVVHLEIADADDTRNGNHVGLLARLEHVGRRQRDGPEQEAQEERRVAAQDAPLLPRGGAEGPEVAEQELEGHSRSARPVREMNTSSRVTGTTSTWLMVAPSARAASNAAGTKSRALRQWIVTASTPLVLS